jgi:hypothetical protein
MMAVSKIKIRERSERKGACVPRNPGPLSKSFIVPLEPNLNRSKKKEQPPGIKREIPL